DEGHPALAEALGELARRGDRRGAGIDDDLPAARAVEKPAVGERDLAHHLARGQREEDDARSLDDLAQLGAGLHTVLAQALERRRIAVECQDPRTGFLHEVAAHRLAHDAETDEAELRRFRRHPECPPDWVVSESRRRSTSSAGTG